VYQSWSEFAARGNPRLSLLCRPWFFPRVVLLLFPGRCIPAERSPQLAQPLRGKCVVASSGRFPSGFLIVDPTFVSSCFFAICFFG
jgi:hypothetical protein